MVVGGAVVVDACSPDCSELPDGSTSVVSVGVGEGVVVGYRDSEDCGGVYEVGASDSTATGPCTGTASRAEMAAPT